MPARMTTPNRLRCRAMPTVTTASSVSSTALMNISIGASPTARPCDGRGIVGATGRGLVEALAPILGEPRLDTRVQRGLRQGIGDRRSREEEQRQDEEEFHGHQCRTGLQHQAGKQQAGTERVGHARRMHPGEEIGHAHQADHADHGEKGAAEDEDPAQRVDQEPVITDPPRRRRRGRRAGRTSARRASK